VQVDPQNKLLGCQIIKRNFAPKPMMCQTDISTERQFWYLANCMQAALSL